MNDNLEGEGVGQQSPIIRQYEDAKNDRLQWGKERTVNRKPIQQIIGKLKRNPELTVADVDLPSDEVRGLEIQDYLEYITLLHATADPNLILPHIPEIIDRTENFLTLPDTPRRSRRILAHNIGAVTERLLGDLVAHPNKLQLKDGEKPLQLSPAVIEKFYSFINAKSKPLRLCAANSIDALIRLDERNKESDQYLNIKERYIADTAYKLTHFTKKADTQNPDYNPETDPYRNNFDTATTLVDTAFGDRPWELPKILIQSLEMTDDPDAVRATLSVLGNRLGYEQMRKMLRHYATNHEDFRYKYEMVEQVLKISDGKEFTPDLRDIYGAINFQEYAPNKELNGFETGLLLEESAALQQKRREENNTEDEKVKFLDIGAGTGRLMLALKQEGANVVGFDLMQKHAEYIKLQDPEAKIVVASWEDTWDEEWNEQSVDFPFVEKSFDIAYCLGRTITHNTMERDWVSFLRKAHKVLKDDGVFIVDTPDPTIGQHKDTVEKHAAMTNTLGIYYASEGAINDGPDDDHTFDRLAPSEEQFIALAALSGFKAEKIVAKEYKDALHNTVENRNLYWRLTKEAALSIYDILDLNQQAFTSNAPLFIDYV